MTHPLQDRPRSVGQALDEDDLGEWERCWNCCGYEFVGHDCGEDTCCCLYPEENVPCDVCNGQGGWRIP